MHQPWAGPVASHASAAALHGIGDLLADRAEFTMPSALPRVPAGVTLHVAPLPSEDVTIVAGVPVTTVQRTIADLCTDGHDHDHPFMPHSQPGDEPPSVSAPSSTS